MIAGQIECIATCKIIRIATSPIMTTTSQKSIDSTDCVRAPHRDCRHRPRIPKTPEDRSASVGTCTCVSSQLAPAPVLQRFRCAIESEVSSDLFEAWATPTPMPSPGAAVVRSCSIAGLGLAEGTPFEGGNKVGATCALEECASDRSSAKESASCSREACHESQQAAQ